MEELKKHVRFYQRHKNKYREKKNEDRRRLTEWYVDLKAKMKCERCPESHVACLDFHHEGDKEHKIASMVHACFSKEKILAEIAKCIVLCANCHRKHHWSELKEPTHDMA